MVGGDSKIKGVTEKPEAFAHCEALSPFFFGWVGLSC